MNEPNGVTIGEAAALYRLTPSTLRWWESRGALPEPARVRGRRVYTEADLRRIGLVYLCSVTGGMRLDQASIVSTVRRNMLWRNAVKRQLERIETTVARLRTAHGYLSQLLECPDDDIVEECSWLDRELVRWTPRGRVAAPSLVAAARAAPRPTGGTAIRDGSTGAGDETIDALSTCAVCAQLITQPSVGRRRRYCSHACRQQRYRDLAAPPGNLAITRRDHGRYVDESGSRGFD